MNIAENRKRIKALRQYAQSIADQLPPGYARGVRVRNGIVTLKACRTYGDGLWLQWDKNNVMTGHMSHPSLCGQPGDGWSILDANDLAYALKVLTSTYSIKAPSAHAEKTHSKEVEMNANKLAPGARVRVVGWADTEFRVLGPQRVRNMLGVWQDVIAIAAIDSNISGWARPGEITVLD